MTNDESLRFILQRKGPVLQRLRDQICSYNELNQAGSVGHAAAQAAGSEGGEVPVSDLELLQATLHRHLSQNRDCYHIWTHVL